MTKALFKKIEDDMCLFDCEPTLAEHLAEVRIARELMARRKANERNAEHSCRRCQPRPTQSRQ